MKNDYNNEKIIEALSLKGYTSFLTQKEFIEVKGYLHKDEYKVYNLYPDSSKIILYKKEIPKIILLKINSKVEFKHQEILGTLFSLGIKESTFGDIVKYEGNYYFFILPIIYEYLKLNFLEIKNNKIELEEIDISFKKNFKQEYKKLEYIVSSLRIDNIVSTITCDSRAYVLDKFKNKEIILNYDDNVKPTRTLKENDVFSIRRYGKYKFIGIKKHTKKDKLIIEIDEYI